MFDSYTGKRKMIKVYICANRKRFYKSFFLGNEKLISDTRHSKFGILL